MVFLHEESITSNSFSVKNRNALLAYQVLSQTSISKQYTCSNARILVKPAMVFFNTQG